MGPFEALILVMIAGNLYEIGWWRGWRAANEKERP